MVEKGRRSVSGQNRRLALRVCLAFCVAAAVSGCGGRTTESGSDVTVGAGVAGGSGTASVGEAANAPGDLSGASVAGDAGVVPSADSMGRRAGTTAVPETLEKIDDANFVRAFQRHEGKAAWAGDAANTEPPVVFEEREDWRDVVGSYLVKHRDEWSYFSMIRLGAMQTPVLLVTDGVQEVGEGERVSSRAGMYAFVGGELRPIGMISCSSSGEWLHFSEGSIYVDTHHSITSYGVDSRNGFVSETREEPEKETGHYREDFFWHFEFADSVLFYKNSEENVEGRPGLYGSREEFHRQVLPGAESVVYGNLVWGGAGTNRIEVDCSAAMAEDGGPSISVYNRKKGGKRIWSARASVLEEDSQDKWYILWEKERASFLHLTPGREKSGRSDDYDIYNLHWEQFYLTESGDKKQICEDSVRFVLGSGSRDEASRLNRFIGKLWKNRLENSELLIDTVDYLKMTGEQVENDYEWLQGLKKEIVH